MSSVWQTACGPGKALEGGDGCGVSKAGNGVVNEGGYGTFEKGYDGEASCV